MDFRVCFWGGGALPGFNSYGLCWLLALRLLAVFSEMSNLLPAQFLVLSLAFWFDLRGLASDCFVSSLLSSFVCLGFIGFVGFWMCGEGTLPPPPKAAPSSFERDTARAIQTEVFFLCCAIVICVRLLCSVGSLFVWDWKGKPAFVASLQRRRVCLLENI